LNEIRRFFHKLKDAVGALMHKNAAADWFVEGFHSGHPVAVLEAGDFSSTPRELPRVAAVASRQELTSAMVFPGGSFVLNRLRA